RKLQEYLAAKGKLKCHNTKPIKAKSNCLNILFSKSIIILKKDVTNHAALPSKDVRPTGIKFQPRPANITGQKPKLEPPELLGQRLTSGCTSSNLNCKPSSNSQEKHKAGSFITGELFRKAVASPNIQELKTSRQQVADQGNVTCADPVDNNLANESLDSFLKEINTKKLAPNFLRLCKPKTNSYNQTKSNLAPKQALGKSSGNSAVLKEVIDKTQIKIPSVKSQQLSRGPNLVRPG
uniref:Uncharacterized protein n=1 Tax=Mustela putorius furo TaxID=9669 RepID=M3YXI7_MUSPF